MHGENGFAAFNLEDYISSTACPLQDKVFNIGAWIQNLAWAAISYICQLDSFIKIQQ